MGSPVTFPGVNRRFGPPPGREEDVGTLETFSNGTHQVSAWRMTDAEIDEIVRTRQVFMSCMTGDGMVPIFVGSESVVRGIIVDYGPVWPRSGEPA
jgi:hypothetical protein